MPPSRPELLDELLKDYKKPEDLLGQQPVRLHVTGQMSNTTTTDLTESPDTFYQSLDEAVAIVDELGNVAGVSEGSTFVKVTNGSVTAQVPVSVSTFKPPAASLRSRFSARRTPWPSQVTTLMWPQALPGCK